MNDNLPIELAPNNKRGLTLQSPIIIAGGYGVEYEKLINLADVGAIVTSVVTLYPQRGAPQPRLAEIPGGFVLHTGYQNIGLDRLRRRYTAKWTRIGVPVIVSIRGNDAEKYARLAEKLERLKGVAGLEINLPTDVDEDYAFLLTETTRYATELPVIVRLPLFSISTVSAAVVEAGAHALTLIAPPRGLAFNRAGHAVSGRVYGVGVKPLALQAVRDVGANLDVPIIGAGGVHTVEDVRDFLTAGACAVQIDSALFGDAHRVNEIIRLGREGKIAANLAD